jgi:NADP-dependent 3-hydroxy acid dehydrogenase YdfG
MSDSINLKGKVAAVTGASSGIGKAIAEALGKAGAHVYMCGRTTEAMEASKAAIEAAGGGATLSAFDMRDVDAVQTFVATAGAHEGGLDIMVNNAGLGKTASIVEGNPEDWREMLEVNVLGLLVGCQSAIKAMRAAGKQGHIINISSVAGFGRESGVYGATKHAVNAINSTLRSELEDDSIRVTSVMPGAFASNFVRYYDPAVIDMILQSVGVTDVKFTQGDKVDSETLDRVQQAMQQVLGHPDEIAKAVLYIVNQPIEINIEELVIRPGKSLNI